VITCALRKLPILNSLKTGRYRIHANKIGLQYDIIIIKQHTAVIVIINALCTSLDRRPHRTHGRECTLHSAIDNYSIILSILFVGKNKWIKGEKTEGLTRTRYYFTRSRCSVQNRFTALSIIKLIHNIILASVIHTIACENGVVRHNNNINTILGRISKTRPRTAV